jgi:eukaryotic-like serine/threonine-protein kinase
MMQDPLIGRQLANFRIDRPLKSGGMAQVYHGWDVSLERPVAIKVIESRHRDKAAYAERFIREARTVATWRHEHIIQIYYADNEDGLYYFVMEHVDGLDLDDLLAEIRATDELATHDDALRIGRAVASALDYAHERGVIHRDVKPANILVARDGRIVLTDFGLAMNLQEGSSGEVVGTARYIAPEQARRSEAAVPQSDIYALGVVLYEMLAGRVPFDDPSPTSLAVQHLTLPPPPPRQFNPALSEATEAVLLQALQKEPAQRYQSGAELIAALEQTLAGQPQPTTVSVTELAAQRLPALIAPASAWALPASSALKAARSPGVWLAGCGLLAMAALGLLFILFLIYNGRNNDPVAAAATEVAAVADETATAAAGEATAASEIAEPSPELAPTVTLSGSAVTAVPPADSPPPGDGRLLRLFYDESGFYLWNPGPDRVDGIGGIAFEALNAEGQSAGYYFNGGSWAQFHSRVEARRCMRIEILGRQPFLRPTHCQGYNATVTPQDSADTIFWLPQNGVTQFRIMWNGQEIGRCPAQAGVNDCEFTLP